MIVADSHLAMILPDDIAGRIAGFIAGKRGFPFIERDEPVCMMYLYGKQGGVRSESEQSEAAGLAQKTAAQMDQDIEFYLNSSVGRLDPEYIRSKYVNRQLQLAVEKKDAGRVASDPAILSDCFAAHVAYHKQDYFFGLYGPLKDSELTADIRPALSGRMVMVLYNMKGEGELAQHPLIPVYVWFRDQAGAKP